MTNTATINPETKILQIFHFGAFPEYFIFQYSHMQKLEIWRMKYGKNLNLLLGEFERYTSKYIVKNFNGLYAFRRNELLPRSINKPLGVAFEAYPGNGSFLISYSSGSSVYHPNAEEMHNVALIADKLNSDHENRFTEYNRALEMFIQWEQEAHSIRLIQDNLSKNHELRKLAPTILEMLETTECGLTKMRKNKIRTEWDYAQHIKMCIRNIKHTTDVLATMSDLL